MKKQWVIRKTSSYSFKKKISNVWCLLLDLGSPEGIALDHLGRNIFWTDSQLDRIEVAKLDGTQRRVLFETDLVNPRGIVTDSVRGCVHAKSLQSCPALCDPVDYSPPGSSVLGILQARTLGWDLATREAPVKGYLCVNLCVCLFYLHLPLCIFSKFDCNSSIAVLKWMSLGWMRPQLVASRYLRWSQNIYYNPLESWTQYHAPLSNLLPRAL